MRKKLIAIITFLAGLFYFLEFVLPGKIFGHPNPFTKYIVPAGYFLMVVAAFNIGLGWANLLGMHFKTIIQRKPGWVNSLGLFGSLIAMLVVGFLHEASPLKSRFWVKTAWNILFMNMFMPLVATVFSLLAFYIVSAAYRAFKIKTLEASLLMAAGFIVMIGQVPLGGWLSHSFPKPLQFPTITAWIMTTINSAACRGIIFGASLGAIAMALRIWLSLERGTFFEKRL